MACKWAPERSREISPAIPRSRGLCPEIAGSVARDRATRTAALARDLHDECNRAVDKYWAKPNKKGDVFCIFDDASDDETVAAR